MRIAIVTGEYPPAQGGVGDYTHELALALARLGHDPHVVSGVLASSMSAPHTADVPVHRVVSHWNWSCWRDIRSISRQLRPELLNIQYQASAYGMHPAINLFPWRNRSSDGLPVVTTFHDLRVPYLFPKAGLLRWQAVLALARWATGVIVTNPEDELTLTAVGLPTPVRRVPIGSNIAPRPPAGYDRDEWRARWRVGRGELLLGYFGFLNERKGGEMLIDVLAALADKDIPTQLLLIGGQVGSSDPTNAAYARRVEQRIAEHGLELSVHRTGFVTPEEVSASLLATDVCVLPYSEGASLRHGSLHACLAHGCPIVTTQPSVKTPELRDGDNILLVETGDLMAMVEATVRLWHDLTLRRRVGDGASRLAEEFTWDRIAARTADFFAELVL
ncbi:MAG: glycosyltransferase family 4 protein [Chloroflexi bacterium]|nr:glycosyltransferase family 4 protein [Chloroflexota bacterium]